ncbi:MAG TPA: hydrolase [Pirellulales bacterium]|nr:hydrolase [Pirellulales bacterium]
MESSPHSSIPPVKSPELMSSADTGLLVVDVQEKLIRLVPDHKRIVWNIRRLIDGAKMFEMPVLATEQYPKGLGGTVAELASRLKSIASKTAFSSVGCRQIASELEGSPRPKWLVVGIEAHVCVQQTVLDLLGNGWRVYVAVDAIGSRHEIDRQTAIARMDSAGATLTTTEAALFEWCGDSSTPQFKQVSAMIKEPPP